MGRVKLQRPPERVHVLSVRMSQEEMDALNAVVVKSALRASDIVRYAVAHYAHRELAEDAA